MKKIFIMIFMCLVVGVFTVASATADQFSPQEGTYTLQSVQQNDVCTNACTPAVGAGYVNVFVDDNDITVDAYLEVAPGISALIGTSSYTLTGRSAFIAGDDQVIDFGQFGLDATVTLNSGNTIIVWTSDTSYVTHITMGMTACTGEDCDQASTMMGTYFPCLNMPITMSYEKDG